MQMHSVETKAGTAISPAPSRMAVYSGDPMCRWRSMFSMVTVASSTRMPTASAKPPSVITLMVSPIMCSATMEEKMDSGMETAMMEVVRQLPRNSNSIAAVSAAATSASWITPATAVFTKMDWSASRLTRRSLGSSGSRPGSFSFRWPTTSSVDAPPFL